MATRAKSTNIQTSGTFVAGGLHNLEYVTLENGQLLVTLRSLLHYLEIETGNPLLSADFLPAKACVFYGTEGIDENFGISPVQVPAFCVNIIEMNVKSGSHKNEAINAMMLLLFLSSMSINNLAQQDLLKKRKSGKNQMKVTWTAGEK